MRPKTPTLPKFILTALLPLLLALTGAARAATLTVTTSADSGTGSLRQALAAAQSGDTITFAPGVTDIALTGGQLTDAGVSIVGPGVTLDAGGHSRVLEVSGGTSASPVTLGGLTLKNGSAGSAGIGGGARVDQNAYVALTACALTGDSAGFGGGLENGAAATVTLTGCTLTGNSASYGGGLFNYGGTLTMTGCTLTGNSASSGLGGFGGGLDNGGTATLTGCTLTGNRALSGLGGGIENSAGTLTLTGCTLAQNSAPGGSGGGIDNGGTLTLTQCALTGDSATYGGGLSIGGTATVTACTLTGDSAVSEGGGLINGGTLTLTGCTFTQNSAGQGGGLFNLGTLTLTGCTFTQNSAGQGGGLYNSGGTVTLTDDILYGDTAMQGGPEVVLNGGTVTAAYSDIGEALGAGGDGVTDGGHNLDADPLFVGAAGDLHLKVGSPAAGRGVAAAGNTTDLDGRPRATPPSIGAYEAAPAGAYSLVVENTSDALPLSLRAAVQAADDYPGAAITFDPAVFSTAQTITLTSGQLTLTQPTTITGPAPGVAISGNNSSRVFEVSGGTASAPVALTGLTVEDGTDAQDGNGGGGIRVDSGYVTLTACALTGNSAGGGGGLFNGGTLTLTACALTGNSASDGGGGLYNYRGTATLTGCTLTGDSASIGGGLYNYHGTAALTDDILYGDSSQSGGEVYNNGGTTTATYSDVQGGYAGTGNLNVNPQFVAAPADLHVQPGSPVIGRGIAAAGNAVDITGATRANPPTIGAYEGKLGTPTANSQSVSVPFNTLAGITLTGSDPDSPPRGLTYAIATNTADGTLSNFNAATGAITYTPNSGYHGADAFTFTVSNGTNTSAAATVSLTVAPGVPTANGQSVTTNENAAKAITLTGTDPDVPALSLTDAVATQPSHGILSGTAPNLTYTPSTGYYGPDAFTFTVNNGTNTSSPATVSLTVSRVFATVTSASVTWGSRSAALQTAADGLRLLPAGRSTDMPWTGITSFTLTLSTPETLSPSDVNVTGVNVASYGPVTVSGSGTSYTVTLAKPISAADRVTVTVGNAGITSFTRRLDVLPGDVTDDGTIGAPDLVADRNAFGTANAFADINGDGAVNITDYSLISAKIGTKLP